jgi:neural Wiskott-Aldrich syndrome protein
MVMTTHDQNKKTLRHFQCRDYLWEVFEQMSTELECSTDYLINEAMRQYARSRNYGTAQRGQQDQAGPSDTPGSGANGIPSLRDSSVARNSALPTPPPPRPRAATPMAASGGTGSSPASSPNLQQSGVAAAPAVPRRAPGSGASLPPLPPPPPRQRQPSVSNPPPLPGAARPSVQPGAAAAARPRQLYIIFNGQKIPVTKEEFVIGRGSKSADLAIKDGNISRRHAAVLMHNGSHYLKDLGSTNGVEFQGRRFDSKRIEEGDLFRICDYELRFTYQ